jgi:hypothetical protein
LVTVEFISISLLRGVEIEKGATATQQSPPSQVRAGPRKLGV